MRENLLPYTLDPYRVNQSNLRHDEMAQRVTVQNIKKGNIKGFITEKELIEKFAEGIKHPDVVWLLPDGTKMSIEIELSAKWERDLDVFVRSTIQSLAGENPRFDQCSVVTDSPAIMRRYKAAFAPDAKYCVWEKSEDKRWKVAREVAVPEWTARKVLWKLLES